MKPSEHLQKARDLIAQPGAWTQGYFAQDNFGNDVPPRSEAATCYCARGALLAFEEHPYDAIMFFAKAVGSTIGAYQLAWNDAPGRTQIEVVAAFDRAIELAKSEAQ